MKILVWCPFLSRFLQSQRITRWIHHICTYIYTRKKPHFTMSPRYNILKRIFFLALELWLFFTIDLYIYRRHKQLVAWIWFCIRFGIKRSFMYIIGSNISALSPRRFLHSIFVYFLSLLISLSITCVVLSFTSVFS